MPLARRKDFSRTSSLFAVQLPLLPLLLLLLVLLLLSGPGRVDSLAIPDSAFETIDGGGIAVVPDFLPPSTVSRLRNDASDLYRGGHFTVDALANYGKTAGSRDKAQFDPSRDRAVLPAYIPSKKQVGPFVSTTLGDADARRDLTSTIANLRSELARGLGRPGTSSRTGSLYCIR